MVDQVTLSTPPTGPNAPAQPAENNPASAITGERPAWLPDNFKTPEDLAKSYRELQAAHTRTAQELAAKGGNNATSTPPQAPDPQAQQKPASGDPATNAPETKPQTPPEAAEPNAAKQVAEAAGFNLDSYSNEFSTSGDVSTENRAKIAEGLKSVLGERALDVVNQYIDGQKAVAANDSKMYMDAAGGAESYTAMINWAAQAMPKEDAEAYNRIVNSGDRHAVLFAIQGLKNKFEQANGANPAGRISGLGGPVDNVQGFKSSAEVTAAMKDPRYKSDPAYRDAVKTRLSMSNYVNK